MRDAGFPQGAFSLAYAPAMEALIRIEAGQLDRAAAGRRRTRPPIGEQHGFDSWVMVGAAQHASVGALIALAADETPTIRRRWQPHIATTDGRSSRLGARSSVIALITFYDAILARLLTAAGRRTKRANVQPALRCGRRDRHALLRRRAAALARAHH